MPILKNLKNKVAKYFKTAFLPKKERLRIDTVAQFKAANGDKTLRLDYQLDDSSTIFDVGGYEGQWAKDVSEKFNCAIYVFEPVKNYAEKIKKNFINNQKVKIYSFGLGNENKNAKITVDNDSSSLFKSSTNKEDIQIVRISDFIKENNINTIDLIKINIEGSEYDLLENLLNFGLIKKVNNIQVQFHNFMPNAENRMKKIQTELNKTHHLTYQYKFVWENWEINK